MWYGMCGAVVAAGKLLGLQLGTFLSLTLRGGLGRKVPKEDSVAEKDFGERPAKTK